MAAHPVLWDLDERGVGDGFAVPRHALVEALQVGACVRPDRQALGHEQRREDASRGTLAVRARNVQERQVLLRIAESLQQASNILKSELDAELLRGIKPRQRLLVDHFRDGAR